MRSQAVFSRNSNGETSVNTRLVLTKAQLAELLPNQPLKPHETHDLLELWKLCGSPSGASVLFLKSTQQFAAAIGRCVRTAQNRMRKFERLLLVLDLQGQPIRPKESRRWRRVTERRLNLELVVGQNFSECPACGHRHAKAEQCCSPAKYGDKQRTCRCARTFARPRFTPKRVAALEVAATNPQPKRIPAYQPNERERLATRHSDGYDGSRKAERVRQMRLDLAKKIAENLQGVTSYQEPFGGVSIRLEPSDPRYRAPMDKANAFIAACMSLGITEKEARELQTISASSPEGP